MLKILFLGDIVGKPARNFLKEVLPQIKERLGLDLTIANGENAAGGSGITPQTAKEILNSGVELITMGDHVFKKKEAKEVLEQMPVIRPLNYGDLAYGKGYVVKEIKGIKLLLVNLLGRVFMPPVDCPFKAVRTLLQEVQDKYKVVIVDMHAEATSEKLAMGYFLAGKVTAVIGTHTHIPTADERILEGFTGYLTDVGMTGSFDSILGREKSQVIERFVTNMPSRFNLAQNDLRIQGVLLEVDENTGKTLKIAREEFKKDGLFLK